MPLIRFYLNRSDRVIIASYGEISAYLQQEFPNLEHIHLPGIEIKYASNNLSRLKLAFRLFYFFKMIRQERKLLAQIILDKKIDTVISDNRYGLYHPHVYSVFITHQLFIPAGLFSGIINMINHAYIKKFNECMIPDYSSENNLSGALSHKKHALTHVNYIGPLSRFENPCEKKEIYTYKYALILSGPEPQKSILENLVTEQLKKSGFVCCIINSKFGERKDGLIHCFPVLATHELYEIFQVSEFVICRSGYSSIMDLTVLKKNAVLIPTPGQPEQEYLAKYHQGKYRIVLQKDLQSLLND